MPRPPPSACMSRDCPKTVAVDRAADVPPLTGGPAGGVLIERVALARSRNFSGRVRVEGGLGLRGGKRKARSCCRASAKLPVSSKGLQVVAGPAARRASRRGRRPGGDFEIADRSPAPDRRSGRTAVATAEVARRLVAGSCWALVLPIGPGRMTLAGRSPRTEDAGNHAAGVRLDVVGIEVMAIIIQPLAARRVGLVYTGCGSGPPCPSAP